MKYEELSKAEKDRYPHESERRLLILIKTLKGSIDDETIEIATHYLEHRELSICLQNLGSDYIVLKTPLSESSYNEMVSLCHLLEIPEDEGDCWFYEKLIERRKSIKDFSVN